MARFSVAARLQHRVQHTTDKKKSELLVLLVSLSLKLLFFCCCCCSSSSLFQSSSLLPSQLSSPNPVSDCFWYVNLLCSFVVADAAFVEGWWALDFISFENTLHGDSPPPFSSHAQIEPTYLEKLCTYSNSSLTTQFLFQIALQLTPYPLNTTTNPRERPHHPPTSPSFTASHNVFSPSERWH